MCFNAAPEDQRGGQPDDVSRREVFPSGLVAGFRKSPDQFLEHEPHVVVADPSGAEVGAGDFLDDFVEQVGVLQLADEFGEFEVLEDLAGVGGEAGCHETSCFCGEEKPGSRRAQR